VRPIYLISQTPYPGVIHLPVLAISFLKPTIDFSEYEGIVVTSKQAVKALKNYSFDWQDLKCIAVSEATASYAKEAGAIEVESADGYGESIPNVLTRKKRRGKWLYLRPKIVASQWVDVARSSGIEIDEAVVYETECNEQFFSKEIAADGILIFTSPSGIRCFMKNHLILPTHSVVVIGKTTQNALPEGIISYLSTGTSVGSTVELARKIAQEF